MKEKTCRKCKQTLSISVFRPQYKSRDGYEHVCLDCRAVHRKVLKRMKTVSGIQGKVCLICDEWKPLSEYGKNNQQRTGLDARCKLCITKRSMAAYWADPKIHNARGKAYYHRNREKILKAAKVYRAENGDAIRAYDRKRSRRRYLANPELRIQYTHARRARIKAIGGSFTAKELRQVYERFDRTCLACGKSDVQLTPDHVVPISRGGSNEISNIQPLCLPCNLSKATKTIDYRAMVAA